MKKTVGQRQYKNNCKGNRMKYIFYITLCIAGMTQAAAPDFWMLDDDNDFEHEIIGDDVVVAQPVRPQSAHSSSTTRYPISARSVSSTLNSEAAVHQLKLHAHGLASEQELQALEQVAKDRNYIATPEQPAKSTQIGWINPKIAHGNVKALWKFYDTEQNLDNEHPDLDDEQPAFQASRRLFSNTAHNTVSDD